MKFSKLLFVAVAATAVCANAYELNGNQELLRFAERAEAQEARVQEDPGAEAPASDEATELSDDDVKKAKEAGYSDKQIAQEQLKSSVAAEKVKAAKDGLKAQDEVIEAAANKVAKEAGEKAAKEKAQETKDEEELKKATEDAVATKKKEMEDKKTRKKIQDEVIAETVKKAKEEAATEAANAVELSPEQILEANKLKRQQQFLTSLTPEAIASAEVELSSVFSGVLGSLMANMLSKQPELVERHLFAKRPDNNDPTKVDLINAGLAVPKTEF
jgi:hypothetical protein